MTNIHQSICSVIPPYVLRNVAERADDDALRDRAEATLGVMRGLVVGRERGLIATARSPVPSRVRRGIYDAHHQQALPGKRVLAEGGKRPDDIEVNEAYDGSGATYDFFFQLFGRRSIDDAGMRLDSTVHFGSRFANAFWNGRQMIYGDGDGKLFIRFTAALDVIAHELTHGVTQSTAGLPYFGQTGALNEHLSDAFGSMVKQYTFGQTAAESDWLIGAGLLGPAVHGKAVRSMAAPGTAYDDPVLGRDPQPAHMRDYRRGSADNGGVHVNSGIPNHAFYLAAVAIGGHTWEVLGTIWYAVLTSRLASNAQFHDFADATVAVAAELFGDGGRAHRAVREAWQEVGVPLSKAASSPTLPRVTKPVAPPLRSADRWRRRPAPSLTHSQAINEKRRIQ
jgi:Zn-dependent metalloprotease